MGREPVIVHLINVGMAITTCMKCNAQPKEASTSLTKALFLIFGEQCILILKVFGEY